MPAQEFEYKEFTKILNISMTANEQLTPSSAFVELDKDADFIWQGIEAQFSGLPWQIIFIDPSRYQLSPGYTGSFAYTSASVGVGTPYSLLPAIYCPAGSVITMYIQELSGNVNAFQLLFRGIKRFTINKG